MDSIFIGLDFWGITNLDVLKDNTQSHKPKLLPHAVERSKE